MIRNSLIAAPIPRWLYIHDDLTDEMSRRYGPDSPAFRLAQELLRVVRPDPERVIVLRVEEQLEAVAAQGPLAPFELALGIGRAGERVARQLQARTLWFPVIRRLNMWREEDGRGGYRMVSMANPAETPLHELTRCSSLAIVDDTIFSGLTVRTVLQYLPAALQSRTHIFCLRGVAETLQRIRARCRVTSGLALHGRILDEVSLINASGLVTRTSIRRAGLPPLAFFERPEWMRAWFPGYAEEVIEVCQRLNALLEGDEPRLRRGL
jgi:hypothetical protein